MFLYALYLLNIIFIELHFSVVSVVQKVFGSPGFIGGESRP
jgi:hypothetical protein